MSRKTGRHQRRHSASKRVHQNHRAKQPLSTEQVSNRVLVVVGILTLLLAFTSVRVSNGENAADTTFTAAYPAPQVEPQSVVYTGSENIMYTTNDLAVDAAANMLAVGGTSSGGQITDRGFGGHRHDDELGLIYMNGRYYVPYLNRFLSADTIVPDPANPQSFNRYSYALNNPLRYTDPSGHCPVGDTACWALADELYTQYGWELVGLATQGTWTLEELEILWDAASAIKRWFAEHGGRDARGRMRAAFGGTQFAKAGIVGNLVLPGNHHVRGSKVHLLPGFGINTVVHEIGHVIDNRHGTTFLAALLGGGKADGFAYYLGFDPHDCIWNRSVCAQGRYASATLKEDHPTNYARNGPSEDFADSFMLSVLNPDRLGPVRTDFMIQMARSMTTNAGEFQGSPYTNLQRYGQGFITPPSGGGGNSMILALFY